MTETAPSPRWPIISSIIVAAACAAMIALGIWQLQRKGEKEAMIALHQRNMAMSAEIAFPVLGPVDESLYYRRSTVSCLEVTTNTVRGAHGAKGATVWQMIADCRTGAEGPGVLVAIGTDADPARKLNAGAGPISGIIVPGPDQPTLVDRLTGRAVPPRALLLADPPLQGWGANARPAPDDAPNNHLAYAVQWFIFAAAAAVIYVLALRKRLRG